MKTLEQLRAELTKTIGAMDVYQKMLDEEGNPRDLTEAEEKEFDALLATSASLRKQIERQERAAAERVAAGGLVPADGDTGTVEPTVKKLPEGFKTFGEQLQAVANAGIERLGPEERDNRLVMIKDGTGMNEGTPTEGGFLVQTDHSTVLLQSMHEMGSVLSRVRNLTITTNANGIKLPALDEDSRVDGSRWGGINAAWINEAGTTGDSKPKFREIELRLNKLLGIGYMTEELLQDAAVLDSIMTQAFTEELTYKVEDAIVNGDGQGKPLGFMNSGAVISVTPESGQASTAINTINILNMFNRLPIRSRMKAVWLINQEVETQLWQLTLGSGTAVTLLYRPPGVAGPNQNNPFGTLLGRPVIPVEYCAALGTAGDIVLVDLEQYITADKGGMSSAYSMHVRFLYDEQAFRITHRVDGQPTWKKAITPANGTNTLSPFVVLGTR